MLRAPYSEQKEIPAMGAEYMGAASHQRCPHIQKRQGLVLSLPGQPGSLRLQPLYLLYLYFLSPHMLFHMPYFSLFIFCCCTTDFFFLKCMYMEEYF